MDGSKNTIAGAIRVDTLESGDNYSSIDSSAASTTEASRDLYISATLSGTGNLYFMTSDTLSVHKHKQTFSFPTSGDTVSGFSGGITIKGNKFDIGSQTFNLSYFNTDTSYLPKILGSGTINFGSTTGAVAGVTSLGAK